MLRTRATTITLLGLPFLLALSPACGDDGTGNDDEVGTDTTEATTSTNTEEAEESADEASTTAEETTNGETTAGDGDGDTATGDGDGDTATGDGDGDTADTTGDGDTADTTGDGDTTTGDGDGDACQGGGNMGFDYSYLWVANSDEGSVSKVNTTTLIEEGRYRTGPAGQYLMDPSRTTVSLDGRFALVGNRNDGSVTLIAAVEDDCIDANNDGVITTSQNKNDLKAWGQDECVLWKTDLPDVGPGIQSGPRGMTFDPGVLNPLTCQYENPKIWVGWHGNIATQAHMGRLDPVTGTVEEVVDINNWNQGWSEYPPYGAAYDGKGNVWFTALRGEVFRLNTESLQLDRWTMPVGTESYGMTVDFEGNAWFGGCSGPVTTFDAMTEQFSAVPGTSACYRGVAADSAGNIWVASNGPCGLMQIDAETKAVIKFHSAADFQNQCSTPVGVSIDVEGYVWMVDQAGWAWKIHPETYDKEMVLIVGDHYTYSDMTGGGLNAVVNPQ